MVAKNEPDDRIKKVILAIAIIIALLLLFDCIMLKFNPAQNIIPSINQPANPNQSNPAPNPPNSTNQSSPYPANQSAPPKNVQPNAGSTGQGTASSGGNGQGGNPAAPPGPGGQPVPPAALPDNNTIGAPPSNNILPNLNNITGANGGNNTPPTPNGTPANNTLLNMSLNNATTENTCHNELVEARCLNKDDTTTYPDWPADAIESLYLLNLENATANCTYEFIITPENGATYYINHTETLGPYQRSARFSQNYPRNAAEGSSIYGSMVQKVCGPAGN